MRHVFRNPVALMAVFLVPVFVASGWENATGASLSGRWEGSAAIPAMRMRIGFDLTMRGDTASANVDLPEIGEAHIPITQVVVDSPSVRLILETPLGADEFVLRLQGEQLQGSWASVLAPDTALIVLNKVTPEPPRYREEEVLFPNGPIELAGTLLLPISGERHSAIVFVHGSGPETRHASRFMAEQFAKAGIAGLIYDKRGTGASGGDWSQSDFDDLAGDVVAAVDHLADRPDIAPTRIGVRGQSQGGWVAPLAATRSDRIAAVITVSGSLTTPALQGHWSAKRALMRAGYSQEEIEQAEKVLRAKDEATRTGDWGPFRETVAKAREEPWFEIAGINPDPDTTSWFWPWYRTIMDFNPVPVLRALEVPLLAILGEDDEYVSSGRSRKILAKIREESAKSIVVQVFDDADHGLRIQSKPGEPFRWAVFADGYVSTQIEWLQETIGAR